MPFNSLDPATAVAAPVTSIGAPLVNVGETLSSLRVELMLRLGGRSDIDPARVNQWINFAYFDMVTSLELDELKASIPIPTVPDKYMYTLPDVVWYILNVSAIDETDYPNEGGLPYEPIDLDKYRRLPATVIGSSPNIDWARSYFRFGNYLVLYPTPSGAVNFAVDFIIRPKKMTADNHSPILGYEWHEGLLLLSRAKAHWALMEPDIAESYHNEYINFVRRKLDRSAEEQKGKRASAVPVRSVRGLQRSRGQVPLRTSDKSV